MSAGTWRDVFEGSESSSLSLIDSIWFYSTGSCMQRLMIISLLSGQRAVAEKNVQDHTANKHKKKKERKKAPIKNKQIKNKKM